MFALIPLIVIFAALCLGAIAFVLCLFMPTRRWALSIAAGFASLGGFVCVWIISGLTFLLANGLGDQYPPSTWHVRLHSALSSTAFGWIYLLGGLLGCGSAAVLVAWVHQRLIERTTFRLFRLYATLVVAGIGSVFGWVLGAVLLAQVPDVPVWIKILLWTTQMLLLVAGFGWWGFRNAKTLRCTRPEWMNPVTQEEFDGAV